MWTNNCLPKGTDPARCEGGYCHACEGCDKHCQCGDTEEPRHQATAFVNLAECVRHFRSMKGCGVAYVTWRNGPLTISATRPVTEPYAFLQLTRRGLRITNDPALIELN